MAQEGVGEATSLWTPSRSQRRGAAYRREADRPGFAIGEGTLARRGERGNRVALPPPPPASSIHVDSGRTRKKAGVAAPASWPPGQCSVSPPPRFGPNVAARAAGNQG